MSDYERIESVIAFILNHDDPQSLSLESLAAHVHCSAFHFQRLFSRWVGISPKRFLQVITVERAKNLLEKPISQLAVSMELGLSSSSRLYDHFIQLEALTPGHFRNGGKELHIEYATEESPFGHVFIARTQYGICQMQFIGDAQVQAYIESLRQQWPNAVVTENNKELKPLVKQIFQDYPHFKKPISLCVQGTNFQVHVWRALLQIPPAILTSYTRVAQMLEKNASAARAVANAIAANPVAFLIPCHRVIRQSGEIGGYRWGITCKHALHAWESARFDDD